MDSRRLFGFKAVNGTKHPRLIASSALDGLGVILFRLWEADALLNQAYE